jgi:predicted metal-binding membrane protein
VTAVVGADGGGSGLAREAHGRTVPWAVLAGVAAAWVAAAAAALTGRAAWLGHDRLIEGSLPLPFALVLFVAAWQLMIVAMMLPSTLPMLRLYGGAASRDERPRMARVAFVGGYATVWTVFGALAFVGDATVHQVVDSTPILAAHPWWVAAGLLAVAGAAQFLPLTEACLHSCRHPVAYLLHAYRPGVRAGYELGRSHGFYCLGCCWGLMLVMFAAGVANLAWMAALTAVMVYAKVGRRGDALLPAVGVVLMVWAVLVAVHPAWLPTALSGVH